MRPDRHADRHGVPADRTGADRGFTLLEVLVAFAIAAGALAVLFRTAVDGGTAAEAAARYGEALSHARSRLAAVEGAALRPGDASGEDGAYRWRTRIALVAEAPPVRDGPPAPALYAVTVAVGWGDGSAARNVELATRRLGPPTPRAP